MTESDDRLRVALSDVQARKEAGRVPDFDHVWISAENKARSRRRRRGMMAGTAAVLALAFVMLVPSGDDTQYIDTAELLETTSWSAPSDSLLPEHHFDIYGEVPVLIEPAETYGGALL